MALLDATQLLDIQLSNPTDEKRYPSLGLVDAVAESTPFIDFLSPSDKQMMENLSSLRSVQVPVIKDGDVTVTFEPGFNLIPANMSEADQYTFVPVNLFSGMRVYPAQYKGNAIDAASDIKIRSNRILHGMGREKEALLQTVVEARKTQVLDGVTQVSQGDGTFTFAADTLSINKAAYKDTMFANISALFDINEMSGNLRYVVNRGGLHQPLLEYLKHGAGNEKNLQSIEFVSSDRYHQTSQVAAGADTANGYVFRDGAIGTVSNFLFDFKERTSFAGKEWMISDVEMPWLRSRVNIFKNTEATNATAMVTSADMIMTHFEEIAFWDRFYIVYPYNSDLTTRPNDIVKIKVLTT